MSSKFLTIDRTELTKSRVVKEEHFRDDDIAVIGVSGKFGSSESLEDLWKVFENGTDCIRELSKSRKKDVRAYLDSLSFDGDAEYIKAAYLEDISGFDWKFFGVSPREAIMMDPAQRLMLECAYHAAEDAGYGGERLKGSKTGVFIGYSNDFDTDYNSIIAASDGTQKELAITGNIKSVIAGRISYFLNLKGPSLLVDSACSSSLTAVHAACSAIQKHECDTAIAGGINIILLPLKNNGSVLLSGDERTKTFDNNSDGTGRGEGVGALVLKRFRKAVLDGDYVYAVIRGSCVNQDGTTAGITVPNPASQEEAVAKAWQKAEATPDSFGYMEAHGTGTRLGDPIEVTGLERAMRHGTKKIQFCGIGSAKTNMGHLDNASGILSLIKVILMLKHKKLPPTLHFNYPNREIAFERSPLFVSDQLKDWESTGVRRCGVSSFGLSGTNCHMVLEEGPQLQKHLPSESGKRYIFTLSAKYREGVETLVSDYIEYLREAGDWSLEQLCYIVNTGRGHYEFRLALIVSDGRELLGNLLRLRKNGLKTEESMGIYYGEYKIVSGNPRNRDLIERTKEEIAQLRSEAAELMKGIKESGSIGGNKRIFEQLIKLYVKGAELEWFNIYKRYMIQKIPLPLYPMDRKRCWFSAEKPREGMFKPVRIHPLIEELGADSSKIRIFKSVFDADTCWTLKEHMVNDKYVMPGTAYIEIIRKIAADYYGFHAISLSDLIFMHPLAVGQNKREARMIFTTLDDGILIEIESREAKSREQESSRWQMHAKGYLKQAVTEGRIHSALSDIKQRCKKVGLNDSGNTVEHFVKTGARWNNLRELRLGENELLAYLKLDNGYMDSDREYRLHPALLDRAVNVGIGFIGQGQYLPWFYKELIIYDEIPDAVYSHIIRKDNLGSGSEAVAFEVVLMREDGSIAAVSKEYIVKRIINSNRFEHMLHKMQWVHTPMSLQVQMESKEEGEREEILFIKNSNPLLSDYAANLQKQGYRVTVLEFGEHFVKLNENEYRIPMEPDHEVFADLLEKRNYRKIIHGGIALQIKDKGLWDTTESYLNCGVRNLFHLLKNMVARKTRKEVEIILLISNSCSITGEEAYINPFATALDGIGKVIPQEYTTIKCRCVDIGDGISYNELEKEIFTGQKNYMTAYRENKRYIQELVRVFASEGNTGMDKLKENGVYIITGGLGGIGLEIAKRIVSERNVVLYLIGRTLLYERDNADKPVSSGRYEKIRILEELRNSKSKVTALRADVANEESLREAINRIHSEHGLINGIFHCAGVPGKGYIFNKTGEDFDQVIKAKIHGTIALDKLTKEDPLDFFLLFSSVSSVFGKAGQSDYTAASAFLNGYGDYRRRLGRGRTIIIHWPAWEEVGMAFDNQALDTESLFLPMKKNTALDLLFYILGGQEESVIVGRLNEDQIGQLSGNESFRLEKGIQKENPASKAPKDSENSSADTDYEVHLEDQHYRGKNIGGIVEAIWKEVLLLETLGLNDSFSDLGGDSILATDLVRRMNQAFPDAIDIMDVFTYPTVNQMTAYIEGKSNEKTARNTESPESDDLEELLQKLSKGEITRSDIEKEL